MSEVKKEELFEFVPTDEEIWQKIVPKGDKVAEMFPVENVDVTRLLFSELNPNVMDKPRFSFLERTIGKYQYSQYATVVSKDKDDPNSDLYIMDGAHRALVMVKKGYKRIPVIIVKDMPTSAVLMASYAFNKPRGKLDGLKVARLMIRGLRVYGDEEVLKWSSTNKAYIDEYTAMIKSGDAEIIEKNALGKAGERKKIDDLIVQNGMRDIKSESVESFGALFTVFLPKDRHEYVLQTLRRLGNDLSKALYDLCVKFNELSGEEKN